jgi:Zn-finger protein
MSDQKKARFFRHTECEYFPCHASNKLEDFNCLFCYCPLYCLGERCGGDYSYTKKGIKDCGGCLFPHKRENYSAVAGRFPEIAAIAKKNGDLP